MCLYGLFKRQLYFSKVSAGVKQFPGWGPTFTMRWGSDCLLPLDTHITWGFQSNPVPYPTLDLGMEP